MKNKKWIVLIIFGLLLITIFPLVNNAKASDTQYEYNNPTPTSLLACYGNYWYAQTFTIGTVGTNEGFTVTSVKLRCYRTGSPGTVTLSIRACSGGKPTGADLDTTTLDGNSFTTDTGGIFYEFIFSSKTAVLSASTQYSWVIRSTNSQIRLNIKDGSSSYSGGVESYSSNSGSTWTNTNTVDFCFYVYGIPNNFLPTIGLQFPLNNSIGISLKPILRIYANDSDGDNLIVTWQSNYSGTYVTKQVNNSVTANSTISFYFSDCKIQFKKYYWRVFVNDGTVNISKWFSFTLTLMWINTSYSNINPINNGYYNYTYDFNILSAKFEDCKDYLNLTFTKTNLMSFNTTTKIYFNNTLLITYTFINGTKSFNVLSIIPYVISNISYQWSINTTFYNLSYNITYNFTFNIQFSNLNLSGNGTFDPNSTGNWLFLGSMLTFDNAQLFLLLSLSLWLLFLFKYIDKKDKGLMLVQFGLSIPLTVLIGVTSFIMSAPFGYIFVFVIPIISIYYLVDFFTDKKEE